jgi:hypothetical protein
MTHGRNCTTQSIRSALYGMLLNRLPILLESRRGKPMPVMVTNEDGEPIGFDSLCLHSLGREAQ